MRRRQPCKSCFSRKRSKKKKKREGEREGYEIKEALESSQGKAKLVGKSSSWPSGTRSFGPSPQGPQSSIPLLRLASALLGCRRDPGCSLNRVLGPRVGPRNQSVHSSSQGSDARGVKAPSWGNTERAPPTHPVAPQRKGPRSLSHPLTALPSER